VILLGALCLAAFAGCAGDDSAPSLDGVRKFKAYPVYYAGEKLLGAPITGELDGEEPANPRDRVWFFFYGDCEPPDTGEGGCAPFQIHNYSTCTRWASQMGDVGSLHRFRGAEAYFSPAEGSVEVFTGKTTISIGGAGYPKLLKAALRQLREVNQAKPTALPPPLPGSLAGKLPCQGPAQVRRAERRLSREEVGQHLQSSSEHFSRVNCVTRGPGRFICSATFSDPTPPAELEIDVEASDKPFRFAATDCQVLDPESDTEPACDAALLELRER
jgi:hypothetical protein